MVVNDILNNKEISLSAKWLYSFLMSKPDTWNFSYAWLSYELKEWEKKIRSAVKELVNIEVLIRIPKMRWKDFDGREWILHPWNKHKNRKDPSKWLQKMEVSLLGTTRKGNHISNTDLSNIIYTKDNNIPKEINIPFQENGDIRSSLSSTHTANEETIAKDTNACTCNDVVERKEKSSAKKEKKVRDVISKEKKVRISQQQRTWNWKEKEAIDQIHDERWVSYYDLDTDNYPEKTLAIMNFIEYICSDICIEPVYTSDTVNCFWYCMYGLSIDTLDAFQDIFSTSVDDMEELLLTNQRFNVL